jgi:hypothetical protein
MTLLLTFYVTFGILQLCVSVSLPQDRNNNYVCVYRYEFYSTIRKNETKWFKDKWMQLEAIMLREVSQAQRDKGHIFAHPWKIDPKDKPMHKNKHDHIQT